MYIYELILYMESQYELIEENIGFLPKKIQNFYKKKMRTGVEYTAYQGIF